MKFFYALFLLGFCNLSYSQSTSQPSSEIYHNIEQFANTGTVMYVAAHPDDENTRLISWLTNAKHYNTVYLSLTRGDGGQNLIGTEKGQLLGLLRTQELLEARKVDGGTQWFTRANDFGYSKTATESLQIWDEEELLGDVVWAIRAHKPSVIITRFDPNSNGNTHGHHTSSAILAEKAFDLAGNPNAYPEQLQYVSVWQPKRLFFNTSWWFFGSQEAFEQADKSTMLSIDVGEYLPLLGRSNNEIAALSRSKHACQGFGAELQRGSQTEWLQLLKGDMPTNGQLLEGISTDFSAYKQTNTLINQVKKEFDFQQPSASLPTLFQLYKAVEKELPTSELKEQKLTELNELILKASGIYVEWTTNKEYGVANESIATNFEFANRGNQSITVRSLPKGATEQAISLQKNEQQEVAIEYSIPNAPVHSPYWLQQPMKGIGSYTVSDQQQIGLPEERPYPEQVIQIEFEQFNVTIDKLVSLQHKTINPAKGEIYEPFYVVPPVAVSIPNAVHLFANNTKQTIAVEITSFVDDAEGVVNLDAGLEWMISEAKPYKIEQAGGKQTVYFQVIPPQQQLVSELRATVTHQGKTYFNGLSVVDYEHIDKQFVFQPATAIIERLNLIVPDRSIGYITGSGDDVAESLRQIGLDVTELSADELSKEVLSNFDVIILGIRAFNTQNSLAYNNKLLWEFAQQGGVVINQYNTNRSLVTNEIAPLPLQLSRNRISEENAELTILAPNHPVMTTPNRITNADFENWVQERGLYFADEWSDEFTSILEGNDTGEEPKQGMLLVAPYGDGYYVYTGLSFFRELPAGVPGAYRLFVNLLSLGEDE